MNSFQLSVVSRQFSVWGIVALLHCLIVPLLYGATHYVDDGAVYYIDWTGGAWGSVPQPSAEWRLADGIDYDTTGAGVYRNYGDSTLATGLTDAVRPGLAEGILSEGQTALSFDGVNDYLYINNSNVLDVNKEDFSVAIWAYRIGGQSYIGAAEKLSTSGWRITCGNNSVTWYFQIYDHNSQRVSIGHTPDIGFYNWHFVVGTFDYSDSKKARLYYGGDLKGTSYNAAFDSLDNNGKFRVGREGSNEFKGGIALVQFWKGTCLSDNQVDSLYNAMKPAGTISLPYPSFQSAVYQASASDTIYGLAGRYRETLEIVKNITIIGNDVTYDNRPKLYGTNLLNASGYVGITFSDTAVVRYLTVRGYDDASNGYGVYADSISDGSAFDHLTIDSCRCGIGMYGSCDDDSIVHCTVDAAELTGSYGIEYVDGGEAGSVSLIMYRTIILNADTAGAFGDSASVSNSYNNLWNNDADYRGLSADGTDLVIYPRFRLNDYRPRAWALNAIGAWGAVSISGGRYAWGRSGWGRGR